MAFSFVHASDLHLDSPFDGLSDISPDLGKLLEQATFSAFDRIIDLCISRNVAFLLIVGDVYNAEDKSLRAQLKFRHGLARLSEAGIASYVVFGNHDPASGWTASLDWPTNVHLYGVKKAETHEVCREGIPIATVSGISYPKKDVRDKLALEFPKPDRPLFSIALLHCTCGAYGEQEPYAACSLSDLDSSYDYWALGHIHTRGLLRQSDSLVVYPGNPQGLNPKETGPRGCYLVEVDDGGQAHLEFVDTDAVRWHEEEISLDGASRDQEILNALSLRMDEIRIDSHGPALVRCSLVGRTPLYQTLTRPDFIPHLVSDLRESESLASDDLVWLESIRNLTRPTVDIEQRRQSEDFVGDFLRSTESARGSKEELESLRQAIAPILAQSDAGKYLSDPSDEQILAWLDEAELQGLDQLTVDGGGDQ